MKINYKNNIIPLRIDTCNITYYTNLLHCNIMKISQLLPRLLLIKYSYFI